MELMVAARIWFVEVVVIGRAVWDFTRARKVSF